MSCCTIRSVKVGPHVRPPDDGKGSTVGAWQKLSLMSRVGLFPIRPVRPGLLSFHFERRVRLLFLFFPFAVAFKLIVGCAPIVGDHPIVAGSSFARIFPLGVAHALFEGLRRLLPKKANPCRRVGQQDGLRRVIFVVGTDRRPLWAGPASRADDDPHKTHRSGSGQEASPLGSKLYGLGCGAVPHNK